MNQPKMFYKLQQLKKEDAEDGDLVNRLMETVETNKNSYGLDSVNI